jgi:hypothetical protein
MVKIFFDEKYLPEASYRNGAAQVVTVIRWLANLSQGG